MAVMVTGTTSPDIGPSFLAVLNLRRATPTRIHLHYTFHLSQNRAHWFTIYNVQQTSSFFDNTIKKMPTIGVNLAMMIQLYTEDHLYTFNGREALARQLIADSNIDSYEKYEVLCALCGYIDNLRKT
ncbi:hypothetical protein B0T13DRAFT_448602 [Neurospora crassa]|nr:hypothetical protein B0T13DRAFT_448602 [Neurospora crassa]